MAKDISRTNDISSGAIRDNIILVDKNEFFATYQNNLLIQQKRLQ